MGALDRILQSKRYLSFVIKLNKLSRNSPPDRIFGYHNKLVAGSKGPMHLDRCQIQLVSRLVKILQALAGCNKTFWPSRPNLESSSPSKNQYQPKTSSRQLSYLVGNNVLRVYSDFTSLTQEELCHRLLS